MLRTTLAIALTLLVVPACKKKEGEGAKPAEGAQPAEGAKPAEAAKPAEGGAPKEMAAPDLWKDYNAPGQEGMALLEKWRPGVIVTGDVTKVIGEDTVWVNTGAEGKNMSLGWKDGGKAAKEKGVKEGAKVKAQCSIGGSDGNLMMLTDCELK